MSDTLFEYEPLCAQLPGWADRVSDGNGNVKIQCLWHADATPSLSIHLERGIYHCFGCATSGTVKDFEAWLERQVASASATANGKPKTRPKFDFSNIVATYNYQDEDGAILYRKLRDENKSFFVQRKVGDGWVNELGDVRRVPYRLPELLAGIVRGATIFNPEGEKDVDSLVKLGEVATSTLNNDWPEDFNKYLGPDARVVVLGDQDAPGRKKAAERANTIRLSGAIVDTLSKWSGLGEKADVTDWLETGHTIADLYARLPGLILTPLSQVTPKKVSWLWKGRIALGTITGVFGAYGHGKSFVVASMAAILSRGDALPEDVQREPCKVLWFSFEDPLDIMLRPRMDWMKANIANIIAIEGMRNENGQVRKFTIEDLPRLEAAIRQHPDVKLVVIDPIMSLVGAKVDVNKTNEVRAILEPLLAIAERYNIAIVCLMHTNKDDKKNVNARLMGSAAFGEVPRSLLFIGQRAPDKRGAVDQTKVNLGVQTLPVEFRIEVLNAKEESATIKWFGVCAELTAQAICDSYRPTTPVKPKVADLAASWLTTLLEKEPNKTLRTDAVKAKFNASAHAFTWRAVQDAYKMDHYILETVKGEMPTRYTIRIKEIDFETGDTEPNYFDATEGS